MIALALLILCAAGTPAAHSQQGRALFGLRPSLYGKTMLEDGHFQYAVKAGSSVQDAVEVINSSAEKLELELYAADMEQASDGSLAPKDVTQKMDAVGRWIELERDEVAVPPKSSRFVSFTIEIPPTLGPGDHIGAVVASAITGRTPAGLNIESRVALIARVRVPGTPKLDAEIGPLSVEDGTSFRVDVRNTGNLLFTAKGTIDISDGGRRVASVPLDPPDIYLIPGGTATFRAVWTSAPLFGTRDAVVSLDTTSPKVPFERLTGRPVTTSYFAGSLVALAVTIALALFVVLIFVRRRVRTPTRPGPSRRADAVTAGRL